MRGKVKRIAQTGCIWSSGYYVHITVDMLGYSLTVKVMPGNLQKRAQVKELTDQVQEVTQRSVKLAYVGQVEPVVSRNEMQSNQVSNSWL